MFFRKRPVTVEAEQFWPDRAPLPFRDQAVCCLDADGWHIHTREGRMRLTPGDWVIRGVQGEFYNCKPDIFEATYEPA